MHGIGLTLVLPASGPMLEHFLNEFAYSAIGCERRAEIEARCEFITRLGEFWLSQTCSEPKVAAERFQNVLPRPCSALVPYRDYFLTAEGADAIGNHPI